MRVRYLLLLTIAVLAVAAALHGDQILVVRDSGDPAFENRALPPGTGLILGGVVEAASDQPVGGGRQPWPARRERQLWR